MIGIATNKLTKKKIQLFLSLIANLIVAIIISIIAYFIISLFFENALSELVSRFNYELYSWIVYNRSTVFYFYIAIVLVVIIYNFISKYVNGINEVYNSLDLILKENNETIKLPSEVNEFTEKLNDIKNDYITSKNNAKEAEQKKNDLIMYMAHDIKTPLTSTIGYLTLLLDERNTLKEDTKEKYIQIALKKALRVEELTNQFFEITRYNLHDMPINKKQINLTILIEQLVDECYPMLQEKGLECKINQENNIYINGDGDKLARAFGNLLKNAINYSFEKTCIEIQVQEDEKNIKLKFINKGEKIPEYKLQKLFEPFFRADESRTSKTGGSGLGLAITKEIIELHNGSISVKNDNEFIEFLIELKK